jgi:pyruvate-formate lyase
MDNYLYEMNYVIKFTEIYQSETDIYLREANCLKLQTVNMLAPIEENDLIAGRMLHRYVGFSPQFGGLYTYFFYDDLAQKALSELEKTESKEYIGKAKECIEFWSAEKTMEKHRKRFEALGYKMNRSYTEPGIGNADVRIAGPNVNLDKLIRLGIPGLHEEIDKYPLDDENRNFYAAMHITIDTISDAAEYYSRQANEMYRKTGNKSFEVMMHNLKNIQIRKPETFYEGIQLMWIYSVISDLMNYGRMDEYLGDLYAADIDSGRMSEEEGIEYLSGLYRQMIRINKIHDTRIIIGGKGRRNEKSADRLAMAIMGTSRRIKEVVPQLTLRYYHGMSQEVLDKALKVNAEGTTFPIIYSDETNIPAVMKVFGVNEAEAEKYLPFGCGEYVLEGLSIGTPNNGINLLKCLEITLQNGYDRYWNMQIGAKTGNAEDFNTFEELWKAFVSQLKPVVMAAAVSKKLNYEVAAEEAGYLHISLLMEDCLERGKGILNGGVRYLNASSEVFGMISAADSFTALKKLVYEEKKYTLPQVVKAIDCNYAGYEDMRKELFNAPKYGNDDDYADSMAIKVYNLIADMTIECGKKVGLNRYNMVSVNNSMSAEWGKYCMASPCGRYDGAPMANANSASIGCDRNGITALLNSMSKFDNGKHVGVINNIRFTKELFTNSYDKIKALLVTFYENGGVQTNLSVVGRKDLENAMKTPDKYKNLLVRIGGFSARFVELNPIVQNELIQRTTYDG